jgi:hypothetical protein
MSKYNEAAVNNAIKSSRKRIGCREAKLIHALLRGRDPVTTAAIDSGKLIIVSC